MMPYDPNTCTYTIGPLRQNVYACLTCSESDGKLAGICYSCSIQCHSKHELVELFSKREFTCDCGTTRMAHNGACKLRLRTKDKSSRRSSVSSIGSTDLEPSPLEDIPSLSNKYNHNFKGVFCSCAKPYNPLEETGNMFQCHFGDACGEDWFHDECIMGFKRGSVLRKSTPTIKHEHGVNMLDSLPEPGMDAAELKAENDLDEEVEEPTIPGFPNADSFDTFICWKCVEKYNYAFNELPEDVIYAKMINIEAESIQDRESKLSRKDQDDESVKRRKVDHPYSIFLKYEFRDRLTEIMKEEKEEHKNLTKILKIFPFLYEEDPIYEPDEDSDLEDDNSSIYDLGSKILNQLPREKAIESVRAYNDIKSKLTDFLRPFADNGKIVTENEVRSFFQQVKDNQQV